MSSQYTVQRIWFGIVLGTVNVLSHQVLDWYAAERDPQGICCPVEFSEALKDCFHKADKQLLHWLERKSPAATCQCNALRLGVQGSYSP